MTAPPPGALLRGRILAALAIVLIAVNVRPAVGALSPIYADISVDVPLDGIMIGVLGMIPPVMFSLAGLVSPRLSRASGLELALVIACAAMAVGPILRGLAESTALIGAGTALMLLGAGVGNILLPAAVKKYFPDRIPAMTAIYVTVMTIGAAVGPFTAAPASAAVGWRGWLLSWAVVGLACLAPWLALALRSRREARASETPPAAHAPLPAPVYRSRMAWMLALAFVIPTAGAYSAFAWLPMMMQDLAGATAVEAGALLGLFSLVGLPIPLLVSLMGNRRWISAILILGAGFFLSAYLGLLLAPSAAPWLWACLAGLGPFSFPFVLALFGLRTRSHPSAAALSGFVQAIGYAGGALGPLLVGMLHAATGGWTAPLVALIGVAVLAVIPAIGLRRPVMLEDELQASRDAREAARALQPR